MEEICEELAAMVAADQQVRWAWNEVRLDETVGEEEKARVKSEWERIDANNLKRLRGIFAAHGYPDEQRFGKRASHDFWLLIQHCDEAPEFQRKVLAAIEPLMSNDNADPTDYAFLYDRVQVNTGRLQRYGTQVAKREDGPGYHPKPLEEPELVNERRARMGLDPLEEYLELMTTLFPQE